MQRWRLRLDDGGDRGHLHRVLQRELLLPRGLDNRPRRTKRRPVHRGVLLHRGLRIRDADRVRVGEVLPAGLKRPDALPRGRLREHYDEHGLVLLRAVPSGLLLRRGLHDSYGNHLPRGLLLRRWGWDYYSLPW